MYEIGVPSRELAPYVTHYWFVECGPGEETDLTVDVYVDGRADLVLNYGVAYDRIAVGRSRRIGESNVDAQRTRPVRIRQRGKVHTCGVRFAPGGLSVFTNTPMKELTDRILLPSRVFRASTGRHETRLGERGTPCSARAHMLDEMLLESLVVSETDAEQIALLDALVTDLPATVQSLARRFGLSARSLERAFEQRVGVSPKLYLRIARFQNALRLLMDDSTADLARLAADCGYYDQSHLVREFHALAGGIPREYKGYMPDGLRDFAPNVVRYARDSESGQPDAKYGAGDDRDD